MDGLSVEPTSSVELFTGEPQVSQEATATAGILDLLSEEETQSVLAAPADVGIAAAGSYSLKWSASDPEPNNFSWAPTYQKLSPDYLAAELGISGWPYTGARANPLADSVAYGPTNISSHYDAVQSLTPYSLALGAVVPFQMEVVVSGSVSDEDGTITVRPYWNTTTTNGSNFGFDPNWGVIAAFVDTADPGTTSGTSATVSGLSSAVQNAATSNERIVGDVTISGLQSGDRVIVEMWVVLKRTVPSNATGNVQTGLVSARTGPSISGGDAINVGNQTVPLLRVGTFYDASVDLSITKSDNIDPVMVGQQLTYTMVVTNHSSSVTANNVFVSDVLDPGLRLYPDTFTYDGVMQVPVLEYGDTYFTLQLGALSPGESITITYVVLPRNLAPQTATADSPPDICDRVNRVTVSALGSDPRLSNNTAEECTGVIPRPVPRFSITVEAEECIPDPGGEFTFTYTIRNTSEPGMDPATITGIFDSVIDPDGLILIE